MSSLPPTIDDTVIWDTWLSQFRLPILNVALDVGMFRALSDQALTTEELAAELQVDARALAMHLAALCPQGFVEKRLGKWRATHLARTWLHPDAKGFWGGFLSSVDRNEVIRRHLLESLRSGKRPEEFGSARPAGWEQGTMSQEVAAGIASFMQAHSQAPALGAARMPDFASLSCLMDIGCGSGVYGIEIARANPALKVVLMDLKEVAFEAAKYVEAAGVGDRVSTASVNMFEQAWPQGPDGHFFSNVFHD
ncbi:MAG: hypothetical protein EOP02_38225, partial [Proteobacteria bacterium]